MLIKKRTPKPQMVVSPCPRTEPHLSHFHAGGQARCPGLQHDCATLGHVLVALFDAQGCQCCGAEFPA